MKRLLSMATLLFLLLAPLQAQAEDDTKRVAAAIGGALGTGLGGGILGVVVVSEVCDVDDALGEGLCYLLLGPVVVAGVVALVPAGTWVAGEVAGGDGELAATYAGMGVGLLSAIVTGLVASELDSEVAMYTAGGLAFIFLIAGPVMGYELSQPDDNTSSGLVPHDAQPMVFQLTIPF